MKTIEKFKSNGQFITGKSKLKVTGLFQEVNEVFKFPLEEIPQPPVLEVPLFSITEVSYNFLNLEITNFEELNGDVLIQYATDALFEEEVLISIPSSEFNSLIDLDSDTTYYVRVSNTLGGETVYSDVEVVTTLDEPELIPEFTVTYDPVEHHLIVEITNFGDLPPDNIIYYDGGESSQSSVTATSSITTITDARIMSFNFVYIFNTGVSKSSLVWWGHTVPNPTPLPTPSVSRFFVFYDELGELTQTVRIHDGGEYVGRGVFEWQVATDEEFTNVVETWSTSLIYSHILDYYFEGVKYFRVRFYDDFYETWTDWSFHSPDWFPLKAPNDIGFNFDVDYDQRKIELYGIFLYEHIYPLKNERQFRVQLSTDSSFNNLVEDEILSPMSISDLENVYREYSNLEEGLTYYLRVVYTHLPTNTQAISAEIPFEF